MISPVGANIQPNPQKKNSPVKTGALIGAGVGSALVVKNSIQNRQYLIDAFKSSTNCGISKKIAIPAIIIGSTLGVVIAISPFTAIGAGIGAIYKTVTKPKANKV